MRIGSELCLVAILSAGGAVAQSASQLRFCIKADPKSFDPLRASEEPSETIRFITGGVLIRVDRITQQLQPELAEEWKVQDGGRRIDFNLRKGVRFSDGSPFDAADVIATMRRLNDPGLRSAVADTFRGSPGEIRTDSKSPFAVSVSFPAPVAGLEQLFDSLAIVSSRSRQPEQAVAGPFMVAEYKSGQYVLLRRNPYYWKSDRAGRRLPYLDEVRLDIQASRDIELLRFRRGDLHLIDKLEPDAFARLRKEMPSAAVDAGPSLDSEFVWFNQVSDAPIPAHKRAWFQSRLFRRAVSAAVQREDIVRLVYRGHARVASGHVSESNRLWWNARLRPHRFDQDQALRLLQQDGFRMEGKGLTDRKGNPVEFSLITNAGSKTRSQIASMLQQDLARIGIQLNVVPLEFGSLVERITRTNQYEACLLGLVNVEPDPNSQLNVWLSSGTHHAWNPGQKTPATPWEAEIDTLMQAQTGLPIERRRKQFDRVQEIMWEEAPILYLVHPNVLVAVSTAIRNAAPSPLPPHLYWNIERLAVTASRSKER
jgi:peptide/nickel transport system substrate-binding protein